MTPRGFLSRLWRIGAVAALIFGPVAATAQPAEQAVKAAFIPKFARYVHWPPAAHPGAGQSFVLCMIGHDPFGRLIEQAAAAEQIEGRGIQVRRLRGLDGAGDCHLAYVQGTSPQETARMLLGLRALPVLTVTDGRAGPPRGIIHFTVSAGRVRFFIDESAAAARHLSISSRLLALALGVRQRRG